MIVIADIGEMMYDKVTNEDLFSERRKIMYELIMYGGEEGERVEYYATKEEAIFHLMHDDDEEYTGGVVLDEHFNEVEAW